MKSQCSSISRSGGTSKNKKCSGAEIIGDAVKGMVTDRKLEQESQASTAMSLNALIDSILNSTAMIEELYLLEKQLAVVRTKIIECANECKHQKYMKLQQDLDKKLNEFIGGN